MEIEFKAPHRDMLAGFRRVKLIPTIEIASNLWWWKHGLDTCGSKKQVVFYLLWLDGRVGVAFRWEGSFLPTRKEVTVAGSDETNRAGGSDQNVAA
jgi:hypothetical protein